MSPMASQEVDTEEKIDSEGKHSQQGTGKPNSGCETGSPTIPGSTAVKADSGGFDPPVSCHNSTSLLGGILEVDVDEKSIRNGVCKLNLFLDKNYIDACCMEIVKEESKGENNAHPNGRKHKSEQPNDEKDVNVDMIQSLLDDFSADDSDDQSFPGKQLQLIRKSIEKLQADLRGKTDGEPVVKEIEAKQESGHVLVPEEVFDDAESPLSFQVALLTLLKTFRVMKGCKGPMISTIIDKIPRLLSDLPRLALIENPRLAKQVRIETEKASLEAKQAGKRLNSFQLRKLVVKHSSGQLQDSQLGRKIQSAETTASQVVTVIGDVLENLLAQPEAGGQGKSCRLRTAALVSLIALSVKKGSLLELLRTIKLLLVEGSSQSFESISPREDVTKLHAFGKYLEELEDVLKELEEFNPLAYSFKPDPYAVQRSGILYTFGKGDHGKLGHGRCEDNKDAAHPYAHENCQEGRCSENAKEPKKVSNLSATHLVKVTSLSTHAVALTKSGEIYTWGNGDKHRLGHGTTEKEYQPRIVSVLSDKPKVSDIACGLGHTLCLLETGELFSWGNGSNGRLGLGDQDDRELAAPVTIFKSSTGCQEGRKAPFVVGVFCGASHSLAIARDGRCYSWGKNNQGQCGHGNILDNLVPSEIEQLSPSNRYTKRLKNETQDQSSSAVDGRTEVESKAEAKAPKIDKDFAVKQMAGGWEHTLALTRDGALYSFGSGYKDSRREILPPVLGHGSTERELSPRQIMTLMDERITYCSCGWDHSMAINEAGELFTWGAGTNGKLGHGNEECQSIPQKVENLQAYSIVQAEGGCEHTLALTSEGYVFSWGHGDSGRLGHGNSRTEKLPKRIDVFEAPAISIAVGDKYNLVLLQDDGSSVVTDCADAASTDVSENESLMQEEKTTLASFRKTLRSLSTLSLTSPANADDTYWPAWMTEPNGLAVFMLIQLEHLVNNTEALVKSTSSGGQTDNRGPFEIAEPVKDFEMMVSLLEVAITAAFLSLDLKETLPDEACSCLRSPSTQTVNMLSPAKCSPMRWVALWSVLRVIRASIQVLDKSKAASIHSSTFHTLHVLLIQTVSIVAEETKQPLSGPETGPSVRNCRSADAQAKQLACTEAIGIVQAGFHYFYPDAASRLRLLNEILSAQIPTSKGMGKTTVVSVLALTLAQDVCISSILEHLLDDMDTLHATLEKLLDLCGAPEYRQLLMAFHLHMISRWETTRAVLHSHLHRLFQEGEGDEVLLRYAIPPVLCGLLVVIRQEDQRDRAFFHEILLALERLLFALCKRDTLVSVQRLLARTCSAITWRSMLLSAPMEFDRLAYDQGLHGVDFTDQEDNDSVPADLPDAVGLLTDRVEEVTAALPEGTQALAFSNARVLARAGICKGKTWLRQQDEVKWLTVLLHAYGELDDDRLRAASAARDELSKMRQKGLKAINRQLYACVELQTTIIEHLLFEIPEDVTVTHSVHDEQEIYLLTKSTINRCLLPVLKQDEHIQTLVKVLRALEILLHWHSKIDDIAEEVVQAMYALLQDSRGDVFTPYSKLCESMCTKEQENKTSAGFNQECSVIRDIAWRILQRLASMGYTDASLLAGLSKRCCTALVDGHKLNQQLAQVFERSVMLCQGTRVPDKEGIATKRFAEDSPVENGSFQLPEAGPCFSISFWACLQSIPAVGDVHFICVRSEAQKEPVYFPADAAGVKEKLELCGLHSNILHPALYILRKSESSCVLGVSVTTVHKETRSLRVATAVSSEDSPCLNPGEWSHVSIVATNDEGNGSARFSLKINGEQIAAGEAKHSSLFTSTKSGALRFGSRIKEQSASFTPCFTKCSLSALAHVTPARMLVSQLFWHEKEVDFTYFEQMNRLSPLRERVEKALIRACDMALVTNQLDAFLQLAVYTLSYSNSGLAMGRALSIVFNAITEGNQNLAASELLGPLCNTCTCGRKDCAKAVRESTKAETSLGLVEFIANIHARLRSPCCTRCCRCGSPCVEYGHDRLVQDVACSTLPFRVKTECVHCLTPPGMNRESEKVLAMIETFFTKLLQIDAWTKKVWEMLSTSHKALLYQVLGASRITIGPNATVRSSYATSPATVVSKGSALKLLQEGIDRHADSTVEGFISALKQKSVVPLELLSRDALRSLLHCFMLLQDIPKSSVEVDLETTLTRVRAISSKLKLDEELLVLSINGEDVVTPAKTVTLERTLSIVIDATKTHGLLSSIFTNNGDLYTTDYSDPVQRLPQIDRLWHECQALEAVLVACNTQGPDSVSTLLQDKAKLIALLDLACVDVNARAKQVQEVVDKEAKLLLSPLLQELNGTLTPPMIAAAIHYARTQFSFFAEENHQRAAEAKPTDDKVAAFQLVPFEYTENFSLHEPPVLVQQDVYSVSKAKTFALQFAPNDGTENVQRMSLVRGCWGYEVELMKNGNKLVIGWADETHTDRSFTTGSSHTQNDGSTKWTFSLDASFKAGDIVTTVLDLDVLQVRFYLNGAEIMDTKLQIASIHGAFPLLSMQPVHRIRLLTGAVESPNKYLEDKAAQPLLEASATDVHRIPSAALLGGDDDPLRLQLQLQMMALQLQVGEASVQQHQHRLQEFQQRLERALFAAEGGNVNAAMPKPSQLQGQGMQVQPSAVISAKHRNMSKLLDHLRAQDLLSKLDELDDIEQTLPDHLLTDTEIDVWIAAHISDTTATKRGEKSEFQEIDLKEFRRETCVALFEPQILRSHVELEEQRMAKTQGSWLTFALSEDGVAPVRRTRAPEALNSPPPRASMNVLSSMLDSCHQKHVSLLVLLAQDIHRINTARALFVSLLCASATHTPSREALCHLLESSSTFVTFLRMSLRGGFLYSSSAVEGLWRLLEHAQTHYQSEHKNLAKEMTLRSLDVVEQASLRLYDGVYWGINGASETREKPTTSDWINKSWPAKEWERATKMLASIEVSDTTAQQQPNVELASVLLCMALEKQEDIGLLVQVLHRIVKALNTPNLPLKEMLLCMGSKILVQVMSDMRGSPEVEREYLFSVLQSIPLHEMLQAHTERTWKEQSCRSSHSAYLKALTSFLVDLKRALALFNSLEGSDASQSKDPTPLESLLELRVLDVSATTVVVGCAQIDKLREKFSDDTTVFRLEVGFGDRSHCDEQMIVSLDEVVDPWLYSSVRNSTRSGGEWEKVRDVTEAELNEGRVAIEDLLADTQYRFRCVVYSSENDTNPIFRGPGRRVDTLVAARLTLSTELCGSNLELSDANLTVRNRVNKKWNSVRTKRGFSSGVHKWFIHIDKCVSKNIFVGVVTAQASVDNYVGADQWGWGYLANKAVWHDKAKLCSYGKLFREGDRVGVTLDMDKKQLAFSFNGQDLGIAVDGFDGATELFPAVSLYNLEDRVSFIHRASKVNIPKEIRPFVGTALANGRIGRLCEAFSLIDTLNQVRRSQVGRCSQFRINARQCAWKRGSLSEVSCENLCVLPHVTAPAEALRPLFLLNDVAALEKWGIHQKNEAIDTDQGIGYVIGTSTGRLYYKVPWIQTPSLTSSLKAASMFGRYDQSLDCFSFADGEGAGVMTAEEMNSEHKSNQDNDGSSQGLCRIVLPWRAADVHKRKSLPEILHDEDQEDVGSRDAIERSNSSPERPTPSLDEVTALKPGQWSLEQDKQLVQYLDEVRMKLKRPLHQVQWSALYRPDAERFPLLGHFSVDELRARASLLLYIEALLADVHQYVDVCRICNGYKWSTKTLLTVSLKHKLVKGTMSQQQGEVLVDLDSPVLPQLGLNFPGNVIKVKQIQSTGGEKRQDVLLSLVLERAAAEFVDLSVVVHASRGNYTIRRGSDEHLLLLFARMTRLSIERRLNFHHSLKLSSYCWKRLLHDRVVVTDVETEDDDAGRLVKRLEQARKIQRYEEEVALCIETTKLYSTMSQGMLTRIQQSLAEGSREGPMDSLLYADRVDEFSIVRQELGAGIEMVLQYSDIQKI